MVLEFKPEHFCLRQFSRPGIVTARASDWMRASHMTNAIDQSDEFRRVAKTKGPRNAICLCVSERNLSVLSLLSTPISACTRQHGEETFMRLQNAPKNVASRYGLDICREQRILNCQS